MAEILLNGLCPVSVPETAICRAETVGGRAERDSEGQKAQSQSARQRPVQYMIARQTTAITHGNPPATYVAHQQSPRLTRRDHSSVWRPDQYGVRNRAEAETQKLKNSSA